jgi:hypothetical protein
MSNLTLPDFLDRKKNGIAPHRAADEAQRLANKCDTPKSNVPSTPSPQKRNILMSNTAHTETPKVTTRFKAPLKASTKASPVRPVKVTKALVARVEKENKVRAAAMKAQKAGTAAKLAKVATKATKVAKASKKPTTKTFSTNPPTGALLKVADAICKAKGANRADLSRVTGWGKPPTTTLFRRLTAAGYKVTTKKVDGQTRYFGKK